MSNELWRFSIHDCPAKEHSKFCHIGMVVCYNGYGEECPFLAVHLIGCRPTASSRIKCTALHTYGNEHSSQFGQTSTSNFKRVDLALGTKSRKPQNRTLYAHLNIYIVHATTMDKKPNGKSQLIFIGTWTAEKIGSKVQQDVPKWNSRGLRLGIISNAVQNNIGQLVNKNENRTKDRIVVDSEPEVTFRDDQKQK